MMELKVVCQCGQKYKFDVEPVSGRMPFSVNCPICGADGTATANQLLAEKYRFVPPSPVAAAPVPAAAPPPVALASGLRINREPAPPPTSVSAAPATETANSAPAIGAARPFAAQAQALAERQAQASFGKGLLGAAIGTFVGVLVYFLIFKYTGYRVKLLAIGVGGLAGWLADFMGKGEGSKELGGITAVLVLAGIVGAQYFVALGWWHEFSAQELNLASSAYTVAVTEARDVIKAVPTGSDVEIRAYLAKSSADGKITPADVPVDEVKNFHDVQLPQFHELADGKITRADYEQQHHIKSTMSQAEQPSDEGTFKGVFLLLLLSKANLFSLAAAAALAFKLSTNA
jgi:uncharacterized membrane protein YeaQ/YmgE (transglycosylase-associated protein family)